MTETPDSARPQLEMLPFAQPATHPGGPTMASLRMLNAGIGAFPTIPASQAPTGVDRMAVSFVRLLRAAGVKVALGSAVDYGAALARTGVAERGPVYWSGRATLIRKPEDIPLYDKVFGAFWDGRVLSRPQPVVEEHMTMAFDDLPDEGNEQDQDDTPENLDDGDAMAVRYSRVELLRAKDFGEYDTNDFSEAKRIIEALRLVGSPRKSRRLQRARRHRTGRPDLRRTVRAAMRTDGTPIHREYLEHSQRPRRIVLLLDVSGSMESYARALMRFGQAAVVGRGKVEVFALGTRLTRVTRELSSRDPDVALANAGKRVVDWSGGTRLGDGLKEFNDRWAIRGMGRGAIVVILSDGWDRGDPAVLGEQMERLHRVTYRLVWVNPLKAGPGYAPLARGMAAALPHVDEFIEGHNLDSLVSLAELVSK